MALRTNLILVNNLTVYFNDLINYMHSSNVQRWNWKYRRSHMTRFTVESNSIYLFAHVEHWKASVKILCYSTEIGGPSLAEPSDAEKLMRVLSTAPTSTCGTFNFSPRRTEPGPRLFLILTVWFWPLRPWFRGKLTGFRNSPLLVRRRYVGNFWWKQFLNVITHGRWSEFHRAQQRGALAYRSVVSGMPCLRDGMCSCNEYMFHNERSLRMCRRRRHIFISRGTPQQFIFVDKHVALRLSSARSANE